MKFPVIYIILIILLSSCKSKEEIINIAIASSYREFIFELKPIMEERLDKEVNVLSNASGLLSHQIKEGAPFDIFISANEHFSILCSNEFKSQRPFLRSRLVVVKRDSTDLFNLLSNKDLTYARADPKVAPFGQITEDFLKGKTIKSNKILGMNVSQVNQYFATGNVDYAFTSYSSIVNQNWNFDRIEGHHLDSWISYQNEELYLSLVEVLKSEEGQKLLKKYGLQEIVE